jgi:hypothetical protein
VHARGPVHAPAPDDAPAGTPAGCLNEELDAFEYQGLSWLHLTEKHPAAEGSNARARHPGDITAAWLTRGLSETVRLTPGDQTRCLRGTISTSYPAQP